MVWMAPRGAKVASMGAADAKCAPCTRLRNSTRAAPRCSVAWKATVRPRAAWRRQSVVGRATTPLEGPRSSVHLAVRPGGCRRDAMPARGDHHTPHNVAEYQASIEGLQLAIEYGIR